MNDGPSSRPCLCGKSKADSVHHRPQTSSKEHLYEPAPNEAELYGEDADGTESAPCAGAFLRAMRDDR